MTKAAPKPAWHDYQEKAATLFRQMGFEATVDDILNGARGTHNVDVVARLKVSGVPMTWIVECKFWKTTVPKAQVLTFIQIAQDVGADRAFLLSESGFQAGAIAVASKTNVSLTSLDELQVVASDSIAEISIRRSLTSNKALEERLRLLLEKQGLHHPSAPLMDATITLLGACLEVTLAATAALTARFPVSLPATFSRGPIRSASELPEIAKALDLTVQEIAKRFAELEAFQSSAVGAAISNAEKLLSNVRELLRRSDALLVEAQGPDDEEPKLREALAAMRSVGRQAELLHNAPVAELNRAVHNLMRQLIDGVYLWIGDPARTPEAWTTIKSATEAAMLDLSTTIGELRDLESPLGH